MPPQEMPVAKIDTPLTVPWEPQPKASELGQKLYRDALPGTVQIVTESGYGSGFVADKPWQIATDWHVVRKATEIKVVDNSGRQWRARIKDADDIHDLAVLEIDGKPQTEMKPLPIGSAAALRPDQHIFGIGHPLGLRPAYLSPGYAVSLKPYIETIKEEHGITDEAVKQIVERKTPLEQKDLDLALKRLLVRSVMNCSPGNSGGPVVCGEGKVIGLVQLGGDSQAFHTPAERLRELLDRKDAKFKFEYTYRPERWASDYLHSLKDSPLSTTAMTGGAGLGTYLAFRKTRYLAPAAAGVAGVVNISDDFSSFMNSTNTRDSWKYGLATSGDAAMIGGSGLALMANSARVAKAIPRGGKVGLAVLAVGLATRVSSDFINNRLIRTDISRTDGEVRPPLDGP